jgi:hypothetical protein
VVAYPSFADSKPFGHITDVEQTLGFGEKWRRFQEFEEGRFRVRRNAPVTTTAGLVREFYLNRKYFPVKRASHRALNSRNREGQATITGFMYMILASPQPDD